MVQATKGMLKEKKLLLKQDKVARTYKTLKLGKTAKFYSPMLSFTARFQEN